MSDARLALLRCSDSLKEMLMSFSRMVMSSGLHFQCHYLIIDGTNKFRGRKCKTCLCSSRLFTCQTVSIARKVALGNWVLLKDISPSTHFTYLHGYCAHG